MLLLSLAISRPLTCSSLSMEGLDTLSLLKRDTPRKSDVPDILLVKEESLSPFLLSSDGGTSLSIPLFISSLLSS